jgi:hypothetical protein
VADVSFPVLLISDPVICVDVLTVIRGTFNVKRQNIAQKNVYEHPVRYLLVTGFTVLAR